MYEGNAPGMDVRPRGPGVEKRSNSEDPGGPEWELQKPDFAASTMGNWYLRQKGALKTAD